MGNIKFISVWTLAHARRGSAFFVRHRGHVIDFTHDFITSHIRVSVSDDLFRRPLQRVGLDYFD